MGKKLQKLGRFYSKIIGKNIGIFLFMGIISATFMEQGWLPNEKLYEIFKVVYTYLIPFVITYETGQTLKSQEGATVAALTTAGFVVANPGTGIMGAILVAPAVSWLSLRIWKYLDGKITTGMELLTKNLCVGFLGAAGAIIAYYILSPCIVLISTGLGIGVNYLIDHKLIGLAGLIIEPAKVFFLNNSVHYGILIPLGLTQTEKMGKSLLFLIETNPGPGLGVLLGMAVVLRKQDIKRSRSYILSSLIEFFGGIHEVYFPSVLGNLKLLIAVIFGGIAGDFCFVLLGAAVTAPVTPGSIIPMIMLAGGSDIWKVMVGVTVSAAVSFTTTIIILRLQRKSSNNMQHKDDTLSQDKTESHVLNEVKKEELLMKKVSNIAVVCDGGIGSSAMGAALIRRKLAEYKITGVTVAAYATGLVPDNIDLIICQANFMERLTDDEKKIRCEGVESLVSSDEMERIIRKYILEV